MFPNQIRILYGLWRWYIQFWKLWIFPPKLIYCKDSHIHSSRNRIGWVLFWWVVLGNPRIVAEFQPFCCSKYVLSKFVRVSIHIRAIVEWDLIRQNLLVVLKKLRLHVLALRRHANSLFHWCWTQFEYLLFCNSWKMHQQNYSVPQISHLLSENIFVLYFKSGNVSMKFFRYWETFAGSFSFHSNLTNCNCCNVCFSNPWSKKTQEVINACSLRQ